MKRLVWCVCALVLLAANQAAANLFVNSSFEDPITYDGPPFLGIWEGFSGSPVASSATDTTMPRTGAKNLTLSITNTNNSFAGVFQDVPVVAGTIYNYTGWFKTPSNPLDIGMEGRIEWRNSGTDSEVSRTPNLTTIPTSDYTQFLLTATAPAGADIGRVVYAVQSFGPEPTNTGIVYLDDFSIVAVPEPATMALGAFAGLALMASRRRRVA